MSKIKNIKDFKNITSEEFRNYAPPEELLQKTKAYAMIPLKVCATDNYEKVPDLLTGGQRKRKYGAVISMAVIPDLAKQQEPVMLSQEVPMLMIDSDTMEDLEARLLSEVTNMIRLAQDTLDGKVVPPTVEDYATEE
tara:strand:- start:10 stop:420 length:411 start_codon:yes stop_codon:yes gene_type:complete